VAIRKIRFALNDMGSFDEQVRPGPFSRNQERLQEHERVPALLNISVIYAVAFSWIVKM